MVGHNYVSIGEQKMPHGEGRNHKSSTPCYCPKTVSVTIVESPVTKELKRSSVSHRVERDDRNDARVSPQVVRAVPSLHVPHLDRVVAAACSDQSSRAVGSGEKKETERSRAQHRNFVSSGDLKHTKKTAKKQLVHPSCNEYALVQAPQG